MVNLFSKGFKKLVRYPDDMRIKEVNSDFIVDELSQYSLGEGGYALFELKKENLGTMEAARLLSKAWHVPAKWIGYAGLKDKRAITTQACSAKGVSEEAILKTKIDGIELKFLGYSDRPMSLGMHKGNKFEITVRDISGLPKTKKKFINYFGEQRLSTKNPDIGKAIVQGNFEKATALLLHMDWKDARMIQTHLQHAPKDYLGALKVVPFKLLKLYVHAYQSRLWNLCAAEHLKHGEFVDEIPVVGFGSESDDSRVKAQLSSEGITPQSFVLRSFPDLSQEGTTRKLIIDVEDLRIGGLEKDERNHGMKKVRITFTLPPGSYATEVIRQLFSQE